MDEGFKEHRLVYPIPLIANRMPAAVMLKRFLPVDHCQRLIALAGEKGFERIDKSRHDEATFSAHGCWLTPDDDEPVFARFAEEAARINAENWHLSLSGIYSPMSVLRYETGDWIRPHVDADYRLADATKLTGIIQLVPRSDFEGGTLTIAENEPYELDIGDAVFFPAHTLHTVAPLTSGVRIVLAGWVQGSAFV